MPIQCYNCKEGLVSQGESIKTVCEVCKGTGFSDKVEEDVPEEEE